MGKKWLSQSEIWDDSALQRTWNAAQGEYQRYHSIHARGENVEELLQQVEVEEAEQNERIGDYDSSEVDDAHASTEDGVSMTLPTGTVIDHQTAGVEAGAEQNDSMVDDLNPTLGDAQNVEGYPPVLQSTSQSAIPVPLLGSIQDEPLKNAMLSWYYAGYYMGLYEGKQSAASGTQQQKEASEDNKANEPPNL